MIHVANLYKSYEKTHAVRGISFEIKAGEIFGLLGPNGAGKTTTIKMLTGQLTPTSGKITVLGYPLPQGRDHVVLQLGVSPEEGNLYNRLSIMENLELFADLYDTPRSRVIELINKTGLADKAKTPVRKLSKGMKQRVLLIRALLHQPRLLVLDEPCAGLDPAAAAEIHQILRTLNAQGTTIVLTTHNMEEADLLCHRVAFMSEGKIACIGRPQDLKLQVGAGLLHVLIEENGTRLEKVLPLQGEQTGCVVGQWLSEGRVVSIRSSEPTLADLFIKVTGRKLA